MDVQSRRNNAYLHFPYDAMNFLAFRKSKNLTSSEILATSLALALQSIGNVTQNLET